MTTARVKINRPRRVWGHQTRLDGMHEIKIWVPDKVLLSRGREPPRTGCAGCQFRGECWLTVIGCLPCEALDIWDLYRAVIMDELNGAIWWIQLPESITVKKVVDVLGWAGRSPSG